MVAFFPLSLEVFRSRQLHFFSALLVHYSTLAYDQMMSNFIIEGSTDTISGSLSPWPFCNLIKIHNEISKSFFPSATKYLSRLLLTWCTGLGSREICFFSIGAGDNKVSHLIKFNHLDLMFLLLQLCQLLNYTSKFNGENIQNLNISTDKWKNGSELRTEKKWCYWWQKWERKRI